MNLEFIFKVIDKDEWQKAKDDGTYGGSEKDLKDGYIHFSEEEQIRETLKKYYANKDDLYPHLYSPLDIKNVVGEYELNLDSNGVHKLPESIKS